MRSESAYSEVPRLIAAFAPEYQKEHYHLHGRNIDSWESVRSIILDEHCEFNKMTTKIIKGALIGTAQGILLRNFFVRGPKRFELDRLFLLHKGSPNLTPLKGYAAFGGLMGFTWWVVKDMVCLPHGQDTYFRYLLAHSLMGGILLATIVHPVNFIHGCFAGLIFGGFLEQLRHPNYPRNFALRIKGSDEQKRNRLLREDEEYELSQRNAISVKTNMYPL